MEIALRGSAAKECGGGLYVCWGEFSVGCTLSVCVYMHVNMNTIQEGRC